MPSTRGRESIRGPYDAQVVKAAKDIFNGRGRLQRGDCRSLLADLVAERLTEKIQY